jgi:hypothetical protein
MKENIDFVNYFEKKREVGAKESVDRETFEEFSQKHGVSFSGSNSSYIEEGKEYTIKNFESDFGLKGVLETRKLLDAEKDLISGFEPWLTKETVVISELFIEFNNNKLDFLEEVEGFFEDPVFFINTPEKDASNFRAQVRTIPLNLVHMKGCATSGFLIAALAHEIGHLALRTTLTKKQEESFLEATAEIHKVKSWGQKPKEDHTVSLGKVLYDERAAWAWALTKLKPFVKGLGMSQDELNVFTKIALSSYSG